MSDKTDMSGAFPGHVRKVSATERLRALLDERGVGWGESDTYRLFVTSWDDANGHRWAYVEYRDGSFERLTAYHLTPEQAVAATLGVTDATGERRDGAGTCKVEGFDDGMDEGLDGEWFAYAPPTWHLSCGHEVYGSERPRYCSACGRRVVE